MAATNTEREKKAYEEGKQETRDAAHDIKEKGKEAASSMTQRAKEAASTVADKAKEMGSSVRDRADDAVSSTGSGIKSMGETVRERGPQEGYLGAASSYVAGTLDSTGRYLEEEGLSGMAEDVTNTIRRHPIPAVLIGIGLGYMLARMTTSSRS